jgi:glyoxylase-like metal-dependent hydrolase (beta-lactamase superfamily II)
VILEQHYLGCLAHASYLVADESSGVAAVVDPQRDVGRYLEAASRVGCRIRHVFLTHFHADFVAGHLELRDREGATIHLGARAQAEYEFLPAADGAIVTLGPSPAMRCNPARRQNQYHAGNTRDQKPATRG